MVMYLSSGRHLRRWSLSVVVVDLSQHGSPTCGNTDRKKLCLVVGPLSSLTTVNTTQCAQMLQGKTCKADSQVRKENIFSIYMCLSIV